MMFCDMCAHFGKNQKKQCTFSGNCIVESYNLRGTDVIENFINPKVEEVVEAPVATVDGKVVVDAGFNPFQRGNGCMLADVVKTR